MESWYNGIVFFALTTTIMACDTNGLIIRGTPRSIRYITKSVRELLHFPSNRNALNTRQRNRSSSIRSVAQFAWKFPDDRYVWVDRFETHENVNVNPAAAANSYRVVLTFIRKLTRSFSVCYFAKGQITEIDHWKRVVCCRICPKVGTAIGAAAWYLERRNRSSQSVSWTIVARRTDQPEDDANS